MLYVIAVILRIIFFFLYIYYYFVYLYIRNIQRLIVCMLYLSRFLSHYNAGSMRHS